jgi:hypothetical protein
MAVRERVLATDFEEWNNPQLGIASLVVSAGIGAFLGGVLSFTLGLTSQIVAVVTLSTMLFFTFGGITAAILDSRT